MASEYTQGIDPCTLEAFKEYHKGNPEVFVFFKMFAEQAWNAGRLRYSAKTIMERVRWDMEMKHPGSEFKINNDWTALYARFLMYVEPKFRGFFATRECKGLKRLAA